MCTHAHIWQQQFRQILAFLALIFRILWCDDVPMWTVISVKIFETTVWTLFKRNGEMPKWYYYYACKITFFAQIGIETIYSGSCLEWNACVCVYLCLYVFFQSLNSLHDIHFQSFLHFWKAITAAASPLLSTHQSYWLYSISSVVESFA